MRLVKIKPTYFRGFGDSEWIELDSSLVVLFGPNAFGKTSLSDALEWLLYGATSRRQRGEALSRRDYKGTYVNVHAPNGAETSVTVVFRRPDGSEIELKRVLSVAAGQQEISITEVDGVNQDFESAGITLDTRFHPIVAQHSLQDFIHAKPKDRRDKISAALGLDVLTRFKTSLDKARTRLQTAEPAFVNAARVSLRTAIDAMEPNPGLLLIAYQWRQSNFQLDTEKAAILQEARAILDDGVEHDWQGAREALGELRDEASRIVFDQEPLNAGDLLDNTAQNEERAAEYSAACENIKEKAQALVAAGAAVYNDNLLKLWPLAIAAADAESNTCPVCEAETFPPEKRVELEGRIEASSSYSTAKLQVRSRVEELLELIRSHSRDLMRSFPSELTAEATGQLQSLFEGSPEALQTFLEAHSGAIERREAHVQALTGLSESLLELPAALVDPERQEATATTLTRFYDQLNQVITQGKADIEAYKVAAEPFLVALGAKIASNDRLQQIDAVLEPMAAWRSIQVCAEYEKMLADTLQLARDLEAHLQTKQTQAFQVRGAEIKRWYDRLNPGASVTYSSMEAGTDALSLWAESFGEKMSAVACLSESQLNCLGLSVNFMRVLTPGGSFGFIVLDDPVQSMDDDHTQALIADVIQDLLDQDLQVVITSHVQGLTDDIWEIYNHLPPLRLRISDYQRTGPTIEDAETLGSAIGRAKALGRGNEDCRRLAVKTTRRCVELLIRACCLQAGQPGPPRSCMASKMMAFFMSCPAATPQQEQQLRRTVNYTNPAPHAQPGTPVPTEAQILPHIQRVENIGRAHGVIQ
jgi:DNA repair exonuclease SbcCD ATPase subunit